MTHEPRLLPFGERALLVELGETIDEATNARVHALADRLVAAAASLPGLGPIVPSYASLLVPFDPERLEEPILAERIRELVASGPPDASTAGEAVDDGTSPPIEIPVRYGGADGPDLPWVAERTGLSEADVVATHTGTTYRVHLVGFAPGFAYLGTLPEALRLPRRADPRVRVPAGSVAIASSQTAVYPFATPGGWHLIGRTGMRFWDVTASPPARLRPRDRVRFVAA